MMKQIDSLEQWTIAVQQSHAKLVVLDFYASWCGPCNMLKPILEKLSQVETNVVFYKIDVDAMAELSDNMKVTSLPTIMFVKGGKVVQKIQGADVNAIKLAVQSHK